ncbi:MAG: hypothetical protein O3B13_09195 [Planctomycetota bacterium]|nr:hypothetical protein [Planctomycetota bacterium]
MHFRIFDVWLILLVSSLPSITVAEIPKAISVSPLGVAPGQSTVVAVSGQNLASATELWTNLSADIHRVGTSVDQVREIESVFGDGKTPPPDTIITEAEAFVRGMVAKNGPFILNGNFTPNYAEWEFDVAESTRFVLELNFASGESRPVKLFLNGELLTDNAAAGKTGGFADSDTKWLVECVLQLRKGVNTVRIERSGGMPHFDKLALVPTEHPATKFFSVIPSDRLAPFEVDIPQDSPVGIYGLRVATPEGISNLLLFMVDDLSTVNEMRSQTTDGHSQIIELPIAVEGYCDVGCVDQYQFHAEAGEAVSIEVVAARLGSKLDPAIRLLNADGRELAFVDDSPGLAGDCCLRHRFENAGDYMIAIEDALMGGASGHRYRMRVGDFPLISSSVPAAVQNGVATSLTFAGSAADGLPALDISQARTDSPSLRVSTSFPGKVGSGFSEVTVSDTPQYVIDATSRNTVSIPGGVSGILQRPGESHTCQIDVRKGDRIQIRDASRSRGIPTVLTMAVRDGTGRTLAQIRKASLDGQELNWSAPADGTYELAFSDLTERGGPEFGYHVELSQQNPDFLLTVEQDSAILPQNGYTLLKIIAVRKGYNGQISLTVDGLGENVRLVNDTIAEKAKETRLKIYLPADFQPGQTRSIKVIGSATINEHDVQRTASSLAAIKKEFPQTPFPPTELSSLIVASVGPAIPDFFALSLDNNAILFPRFVGEVYFTVRVKDRVKGFKDPVNIRIEGLPGGFSAGGGEQPVSRSDNNEYRFQLNGPTSLDRADIPIRIVGEASYKGQTKEVELTNQQLKVIDPLLLSVEADGPVTAGSRRKLRILARRFVPRAGGDKKQIDLEFSSIPTGVSLPARAVIDAGKSETTVELTVGPDVNVSTLSRIEVTARTIVADNEVSATASVLSQSVKEER